MKVKVIKKSFYGNKLNKVGDIIEIGFGNKTVKVEVLAIADTSRKEEAKELFRYL